MKKGLIITTTLAMALGVGVAVGAHRADAKVAKAYGSGDTTWYLCHEGNSWSKNSAADHFTYSKDVGNNWEFETDNYIELAKDEKFNIVYSWNEGAGWNTFTPNLMSDQSEETVFEVPSEKDYAVALRAIKVKFFFQVYGEGASWTGLYWEEYEEPAADPVYTIKNRNNTPVQFELDEDDKPEGVVHQYSAQIQYAKRGGEVKFYADGELITSKIGVDAGDEEHINNVYGNTTDGFRIRHTANYSGNTKVWLKTYADGGLSIWGEGFDTDTYYAQVKTVAGGGATGYYLYLDETYEPNETYIEQYKTSSAVVMKALAGEDWSTSNGFMCGALSEGLIMEDVAGNNAKTAFQSTAWTVHNDCEEVIYVKVRKTDLAAVMYIGGYEDAVSMTIGEQTVTLHKSGDDEYKVEGVSLSTGDQITAFSVEGEAVTVKSTKSANNNLGENKKVIVDATADIYYHPSDDSVWVSGLPTGGQHILKNGHILVATTHIDPYDGYDQYMSGATEFAKDDTFKILNTGVEDSYPVTWCIQEIEASDYKDKFEYVSATDEIKCVEACSVTIYIKIKDGQDKIYFGLQQYLEDAKAFANGFKSAMAESCSAPIGSKQSAVEEAWAAQATAFKALSDEAQGELKLGDYSSVAEVREFGKRYVGIYEQHAASWELEEFLDWKLTPNANYRDILDSEVNNNSLLIIVISIASVSAIALGTLLILKKKHK